MQQLAVGADEVPEYGSAPRRDDRDHAGVLGVHVPDLREALPPEGAMAHDG